MLNGGIATVEAAQAHRQHVDGVMLGRAAYHDPYLLHLLECAQTGAPARSRRVTVRLRVLEPEPDLDGHLEVVDLAVMWRAGA